ncbi:MAG: SH3 domain-containing protein [Anaerolineales bacterium]
MVRKLMILCLVGVAVLAIAPMTAAQGGATATVVPDALNVRETPSANAAVVGQFTINQTVTVSGRDSNDNDGILWVLASNGGLTGWVDSTFLLFPSDFAILSLPETSGAASAPPATTGDTPAEQTTQNTTENAPAPPPAEGGIGAQVIADANVRAQATTAANRVGGTTAGTRVTLTGRNADSSWVFGSFGNAQGWMASQLVQADAPIPNLPVTDAQGNPTTAAPAPEQPAEANAPANNTGAPPPPVAGGGSISGFNFGAHVAGSGNVGLMRQMGMGWMKYQVRYNRGDNPAAVAGLINEIRGNGMRSLLGVVGNTPSQIAEDPDGYFQDYANFVGGLAALGADAIEVWNEPNLDREWPSGMIDPGMYTRLLALSYNAIKSSNPNTIVISAAPAPTGFFGGCTPGGCDDRPYLEGMRAAGAAQYMDCVGAHYNEGIVPPTARSGDPRSEYYTRYYPAMVDVYFGVFNMPVCFTELGYVTPEGFGPLSPGFAWGADNTLAEQATWLADVVALASRDSRVRLLIIWNLDKTTGGSDPMGAYAMIRPDGSCPACQAIINRR